MRWFKLLSITILIMLSGCKAREEWFNDGEVVNYLKMQTEFSEYSTDVSEIHFTLTNNGTNEFRSGERFFVLHKDNDRWYIFPFSKGTSFKERVLISYPGNIHKFSLTSDMLERQFTKGSYRIGNYLYDNQAKKFTVLAEFNIK